MALHDDDEHPDPKLALIQALVSLALLIGLPLVLEAPTTPWGVAGLVVAAMLLMAFLAEGVVRFIRARRRPFPDSMLPPELEEKLKKKKLDD
jgi:hypothetical protein